MIAPFPQAFFASAGAVQEGSTEQLPSLRSDEVRGVACWRGQVPDSKPDEMPTPPLAHRNVPTSPSVGLLGVTASASDERTPRTFYDSLWTLLAPNLERSLREWDRGR